MKLEKLDDGQFKIGEEDAFVTNFFILNQSTGGGNNTIETVESFNGIKSPNSSSDDAKDNVLCFKYGKGVLIYNDEFAACLSLKDQRIRIQKSLLMEQNGLTEKSMEDIKSMFKDCFMMTQFMK